MNFRPRPGLTLAVAAALAGTAPLTTPPAAADDQPLIERCYTQALTEEETAAGAVSEIDCYQVPVDEPAMAMRGTITFAVLYDTDGTGGELWVTSPAGVTSCTGRTTVFGTGHAWDNRVDATDLWSCGSAKHWQWSNFTGANQLVTGSGYTAITGTMNDATSSIEWA